MTQKIHKMWKSELVTLLVRSTVYTLYIVYALCICLRGLHVHTCTCYTWATHFVHTQPHMWYGCSQCDSINNYFTPVSIDDIIHTATRQHTHTYTVTTTSDISEALLTYWMVFLQICSILCHIWWCEISAPSLESWTQSITTLRL